MRSAADHESFVRENAAPTPAPLVPELSLYLATELTPLWEATEAWLEREQLPPPYWAFCWPGSAALARLVLDQPSLVEGRRVLDFAAGCGVAALAAASSGARRVLAAEIDPFASAATRVNAALNGLQVETTDEDLVGRPLPEFDLILAGDVCYEKPMAAAVTGWLEQLARRGAEVLLADPGRAYPPRRGLIERASYTVPTLLELEDHESKETRVFQLLP
ncbi:MAG: 50S ribosomal protein L11 methyltransferase [Deltaproteobacteria bacterium]|nr:50S ribosomal protein L11 methyltransferase [Deltaproteobacteria bacterium]